MRWLVCLMFAGGVVCQAAEPVTPDSAMTPRAVPEDSQRGEADQEDLATEASAAAETDATANTAANDAFAPRKPLDLKPRDIREYLTPAELRALHESREVERNTIIVQADAPLLPVKSEEPIPSGMPLLPLWWAVTHPTQAWRIFLPDLNQPPAGPPDSKIPEREFRWGP